MDPTPADALRSLRAAAEGHLALAPDRVRPIRFVIDRRRGRLVFPLPPDEGTASEAQLLVPGEKDPVIAALLSIETARTAPPDAEIRHEIYHGPSRDGAWALATIEAVRYHGEAFDGEDIDLTDAIIEHEAELCRGLNADTDALRAACERWARARVEHPVAVGVDPDGVDVRARFGIVRLEFDEPAETVAQVRERIAGLTARSRT